MQICGVFLMRILTYIFFFCAVSAGTYYAVTNFDKIDFSKIFTIDQKKETPDMSQAKKFTELPEDMITYQFKTEEGEDDGKIFGDIQDIIKRGELVVIAKRDDNNHLFQMKTKDGRYVGKDIEMARIIAANLGVKLKYRMLYKNYEDIVDAIEKGEGDIGIAKMSYTVPRARKISFSDPYTISRKMLLVNRVAIEKAMQNSIEKALNVKNATIGTVSGTSYESFIEQIFPKATHFYKDDWENDIIKSLEKGKITAAMRDEVRIKILLKKRPTLLIKLLPIILSKENDPLSAIVKTEDVELLLFINKVMAVEQCVDTVDDLIERYEDYVK